MRPPLQQGREITSLGQAYKQQNSLITALQQNQLQQGQTIDKIHTVQTDLLSKINILVKLISPQDLTAKDCTKAEQSDEKSPK